MKMGKIWRILLGLAGLFLAFSGTMAQGDVRLRLGEPDVSGFPLVRIPLHTANSQGAPVADLTALSLRENGIPLDLEVTAVPTNMDIIFVLDANADFTLTDAADGQTRQQKTAVSMTQFAGRFMNQGDQISVIVPGEGGVDGRFLIQNETNPDIAAQTVTAYTPEPLTETPLQDMLTLAINHAAQNGDGRYQAVLLFTDGGRLHQQLNFAALVEQAGVIHLPIFVAILGAQVDNNELANVAQLTEPTSAGYVHMAAVADVNSIYLAWQGQANQSWLVYESLQTRNGRYPITVNLGSMRASTELVLELAAPEVALELSETEFHRVGRAHDTPLAELEPTQATVSAAVSWPDGIPRPLTAVALFVGGLDGQTRVQTEIQPDETGQLTLDWDMQLLREGAYQMVVQIADGYGYSAESEPVVVTIWVERPDPPTPTPLPPTPVPETAVSAPQSALSTERLLLALGFSLLAGILAAVLLWRRWRAGQRSGRAVKDDRLEQGNEGATVRADALHADSQTRLLAYLEDDGIALPLTNDNVTIGRDETAVQLVLADKSVSRLHARIRWRDGRYWLYDEGSAGGTRLNFDRLGLAPRSLQDGDQIQIGHLRLHFRLGEIIDEEE